MRRDRKVCERDKERKKRKRKKEERHIDNCNIEKSIKDIYIIICSKPW